MGKPHPDDILVVGLMQEASGWPEWDRRNVLVSGVSLDRQLRGRRFRRAYVTSMGIRNMDSRGIAALDVARVVTGGEIVDAQFWRPEPESTRWQRIGKAFLRLCERFG